MSGELRSPRGSFSHHHERSAAAGQASLVSPRLIVLCSFWRARSRYAE